jgi:hypothetical protein
MGPVGEKEIIFRKGNTCGITVQDAISGRYNGLEGRDSRPFDGVSVTDQCNLRIEVSLWALVGASQYRY